MRTALPGNPVGSIASIFHVCCLVRYPQYRTRTSNIKLRPATAYRPREMHVKEGVKIKNEPYATLGVPPVGRKGVS